MPLNRSRLSLLLMVALLAACASPRSNAPTPVWTPAPAQPAPMPATREPAPAVAQPVRPPGTPAPAASTVLDAEYRWLRELFGPTPVRLAKSNDGSITLGVPMAHAFDDGSNEPKPALQAVLGKLAESMARQPQATLLTQVPGPTVRALALRDTLAAQGVPPGRVASTSVAADAAELVLRLVP